MNKHVLIKIFSLIALMIIFQQIFFTNATPIQGIQTNIVNNTEIESSDDLIIDITQNTTSVGLHSNIEFDTTLTNNATDRMQNLNSEISITAPNLELNPAGDQFIPSLESGESFSFKTIVSTINQAGSGQTGSPFVDLVLVIDASGSMGEEISSVQQELTTLINNLSVEIPDLRIGVIIHGWTKFSEYPADSGNNYLELTDQFNEVTNFINSLYASGGTEPWGDALYFVNGWDWREKAQKLIIIVGDEDCDPGKLVGKNSGGGCYNGSELLNAVTELKNKDIRISTVICHGSDENTENQFFWISKYTEGKTVFLLELENGENPITLPELIQEWTLELSRESSSWFIVKTNWIFSNVEYSTEGMAHFWMDFSSPSIISYEKIIPKSSGLFDVSFSAEVKDFSNVSSVGLYHNGQGSWTYNSMVYDNKTSLYNFVIYDLPQDYNLSFFIEAMDELGNSGKNSDSWLIVGLQTKILSETVKIPVVPKESVYSLFNSSKGNNYLFFIGERWIENISIILERINTNQDEICIPNQDILIQTEDPQRYQRVFQFDMLKEQYLLNISTPDLQNGISILEYSWLSPIHLENQSSSNSMNEKIRTHLYQWTLNDTWNLFVDYTPESDLVVFGEVYNSNWIFIGTISVTEYLELPKNTYYVIIHADLREGIYSLVLSKEIPDIIDRYYGASGAPGFSFIASIFAFGLLFVLLQKKTGRG